MNTKHLKQNRSWWICSNYWTYWTDQREGLLLKKECYGLLLLSNSIINVLVDSVEENHQDSEDTLQRQDEGTGKHEKTWLGWRSKLANPKPHHSCSLLSQLFPRSCTLRFGWIIAKWYFEVGMHVLCLPGGCLTCLKLPQKAPRSVFVDVFEWLSMTLFQ